MLIQCVKVVLFESIAVYYETAVGFTNKTKIKIISGFKLANQICELYKAFAKRYAESSCNCDDATEGADGADQTDGTNGTDRTHIADAALF